MRSCLAATGAISRTSSALDDFSAGVRALDRLTKPREVDGKTVKGINFFDPVDSALLHALQNPTGQHRRHSPGRPAAGPRHVLARPDCRDSCAGCATSA